ncbi:MAG: SGNH/GDSL hydrolase family protein [Clostridia bacterium]|nr:SGNH/GDSL hydrolase family protein [Clostridia bacterium]
MKVVFLGDSITVGTYTAVGETSPQRIAKPNYVEILKEHFSWQVENLAFNGTPYSSTSSVHSQYAICKRVEEISCADIVFVAGGTNDYGTSVELGKETDEEDVSFFGAVNIVFKLLKNKAKKVVVITPIPRLREEENSKGYTLSDYRRALAVLARKYGYQVIDGQGLPIRPWDEEHKLKYMFDGVHLSIEGHQMYAEYILEQIYDQMKR